MAYYDALKAAWNAQGIPAGASGTAITGAMTTAQKIAAVNSWTLPSAQRAVLSVNAIINAIVPADFIALSQLQLSQMTLLLGGNQSVDASPGTTIRAVFQSIFAGKGTTLGQLGALVAPYDNATVQWVTAAGGGALHQLITQTDCDAAGLV
jgi:N-methylhydantoinase B/oxoprolinase/acetone carboxylase alpha subunit